MPRRAPPEQLELLPRTELPSAVARFDEVRVRAGTTSARICKAVAEALHGCERSRAQVAEEMGAYLGTTVTVNMVNAYASQAREDHAISVPRFLALVAATGDRRLLQLLAEPMGWAVVEQRHLALIQMAVLHDQEEQLRDERRALRRSLRRGARR